MTQKLTLAAKKRITSDWQSAFPLLATYSTMWLLKRHGPILVGLCLDRTRSNDSYIPVFHVHCLARPSSNLRLTLAHPLAHEKQPRVKREVKVAEHSADFDSVVGIIRQRSNALSSKTLSLDAVLGLYSEYCLAERDPAICRFPSALFADVIVIVAAAGHREKATELFEKAIQIMESWPDHEIRPATWRDDVSSRLDTVLALRTVNDEIKHHKLAAIPDYGLELELGSIKTIIDLYEGVES